MLTVNSTINLAGQAVPNIIPAVQGDTGRAIVFTLADFTIPAGSTATYYVQKPSGEAVYNAATINGNKVTVELTAQALAETGDNYGQVRILNGDDVVTSFDFILLVKPFRGIEAIESTTEMNIFDEAVQNAMEQVDSMLPDIIAPEFDSSTEYAAGDYVLYAGKLYQFTAAHSGAWTGTDAEETTVTEKLGGGSGDGLTEEIKQALLQIAEKVAYIDDQGATYYQALEDALYPPAELDSISAVYTQSGTVYDTDTLDSLKPDLVVTAHYSDQTTETVTTYTLSGTLTVGTSTVTVAYGGQTTTFNVTVSQDVNSEVLSFGTCISGNNTSIRFNGTTFEDQTASNEWQVKSTIAASRISIVWDSTEADAFQIAIGQRDANGDPYKVSNLNRYSSNPVTDGSAFTSSTWKDPAGLVWTAISGGNIEITLPTTGLVLVAARRSSGTGEASTNARMATWLTDSGLTITAYK